ncbi:A24 family peptidase [Streptomyces sp. NPDC006743]|uniref:A24 family peptidase n=1 Tax=Streptomyces sp. NPDC006743 TaxID=3154480 RepID=UPI00345197F0
MRVLLIVVAVLWGTGAGLLVPRAAHRLSVAAGEPWRAECPGGHAITGVFGGWLGPARCISTAPHTHPAPLAPHGNPTPPAPPEAAPRTATHAPQEPNPTAPPEPAPAPHKAAASGAPHTTTPRNSTPTPPTATPQAPVSRTPHPTPVPNCAAYGPSTPLVTAVTVLVCGVLAAATGPHPEAAVWLLAAPAGVLLALVDHRVHRLPDVLTLPLAAATAALLGVAALAPAASGSWPGALLGGLALGACYFALFLVNPAGLGFGDVKLALALGTALGWYGWPVLVTGGFAGLFYGAVYGLGLIVLRGAGRGATMPLGPFMIGGAFTGVLLGAAAVA